MNASMDLESVVKALTEFGKLTATSAAAFNAIKKLLPKRKRPTRDPKKLGEEVDQLEKAVWIIIEVLQKYSNNFDKILSVHAALVEALRQALPVTVKKFNEQGHNIKQLLDLALSYEARLEVLEASMQSGKTISKV
jgi:hypothetical protein